MKNGTHNGNRRRRGEHCMRRVYMSARSSRHTVRSDATQHAAPRARRAPVSRRDLQAHLAALIQHVLACMYSLH